MPRYIVISGLPASGKSTIARCLANALTLPILDKDDFLERLYDCHDVPNEQMRTHLSRQADAQFIDAARSMDQAVLASWWHHPHSRDTTGTNTQWLAPCQEGIVEVHCQCDPNTALARFNTRARHPGHRDRERDPTALKALFERQAALGPLGIGQLIEIQTGPGVMVGPVISHLTQVLKQRAELNAP